MADVEMSDAPTGVKKVEDTDAKKKFEVKKVRLIWETIYALM
jgi:hypothetical protein